MYIIIGVLSLMVILCFVLIIALSTKLEKVTRRQNLISSHLSGETVDVLLEKSLDRQEELAGQIQKNQENIKKLQDHSLKTFDKIEVLRYSSNPDDENDTSFSIGITNLEENGIIITGLQSSTGTKLLVKKVKRGSAEEDVTDEELSVIDRDN
ncbi:MAG: DUF4446 family protein [Clostridia bacterium]|nr:DUF4446 family protein [Clostridia bacterium]